MESAGENPDLDIRFLEVCNGLGDAVLQTILDSSSAQQTQILFDFLGDLCNSFLTVLQSRSCVVVSVSPFVVNIVYRRKINIQFILRHHSKDLLGMILYAKVNVRRPSLAKESRC